MSQARLKQVRISSWGSLEVTVGELKEELWEKENRFGRAG